MSFEVEGFTGQSLEVIKVSQLEKNQELFSLAASCSRHAMQMTMITNVSEGDVEKVASLYFLRNVSLFQSAIHLAEGGMMVESLILCRSLIESFFVLNSLAIGVVTPQNLYSSDGAERRSHADVLLNNKKRYDGVEVYEKELKDFIRTQDASIKLSFYDCAEKGKALQLYDSLYRFLSHNAAHPSLSAVNPYLVEHPVHGVVVDFHPILDYTEKAILGACLGILLTCFAFEKLNMCDPETINAGAGLWMKYEQADDRYRPWE